MGKLIHKGYYTEMLRQLKTPAIISACILMVWHVSSFLVQLLMNNTAEALFIPGAVAMARNPMYYAYVMGLVFTFIGFSWLNKRSYSDFYHALPVSRTAVYFSTVAAILTWMFASVIATAILNALLYLVFGLPYNYLLNACVIVNVLIACIAVVGAVSIACAFSGTRFVNLIASVVILFMPRVMLTIFGALVGICGKGVLDVTSICWLFDPSYNIAGTSLYSSILALLGLGTSYTNVIAMLYNLLYAALLVFIGWRVFLKRRSEDAGMPTTNKLFQSCVRCGVGLPLLLILAGLMVSLDYGLEPILIILLVVFSFIFYCLYELISTKSMKKVVKAMPGFLICIGICLAYMFLPHLVAKAELSIRPEPEQIKAIYLEGEDDTYSNILGTLLGDSYYTSSDPQLCKVKFTDERAKKIVSDACRYSSVYGDDLYAPDSMKLRIDRKFGKTIVRTLYFTDDQMNELSEIISSNEEYRKALAGFPDLDTIYCSVMGLDRKQSRQIAELYKEEFSALTVEQQMLLRADTRYGLAIPEAYDFNIFDSTGTLNICGCRGVDNFSRTYNINELTPNTEKLLIKLKNDSYFDDGMAYAGKMLAAAEGYEKDSDSIRTEYYWIDIETADGSSSIGISLDMMTDGEYWKQGDGEDVSALATEAIRIICRGTRCDAPNEGFKVYTSDNGFYKSFNIGLSKADSSRLIEIMDILNGDAEWIDEEIYFH